VGRLFDAVAALVGAGQDVWFEGEAAARLETLAAHDGSTDSYAFALHQEPGLGPGGAGAAGVVLDPQPMFGELLADLRRGVPAGRLAARFHHGLADALVQACGQVLHAHGDLPVVLSGGVFVNGVLLQRVRAGLETLGVRAYSHRLVPPNDGGLCLGQLAVAAGLDARSLSD